MRSLFKEYNFGGIENEKWKKELKSRVASESVQIQDRQYKEQAEKVAKYNKEYEKAFGVKPGEIKKTS